jgi:hypothetical protein
VSDFLLQLAAAIASFLRALLYTTVLMAAVSITVRWVLPILLPLIRGMAEECVAFAGACLLLPEYWLSTVARRRSGYPPRIAYEYGDAVAGLCRILHIALQRSVQGLTVAAQEVPLPLVAVLTGGIYLALLLR